MCTVWGGVELRWSVSFLLSAFRGGMSKQEYSVAQTNLLANSWENKKIQLKDLSVRGRLSVLSHIIERKETVSSSLYSHKYALITHVTMNLYEFTKVQYL